MKRILILAMFAALAACGGQASAQTIPAQTGAPLDAQMYFGTYQTVDVAGARAVDLISGSFKVTDNVGNEITGGFQSSNAFFNSAAFQRYVRTAYNGGWRWWNTAAMARTTCANGVTTIYWQSGPASTYNDGCALQQLVSQYSRKM